jgi:hypothetical protein
MSDPPVRSDSRPAFAASIESPIDARDIAHYQLSVHG